MGLWERLFGGGGKKERAPPEEILLEWDGVPDFLEAEKKRVLEPHLPAAWRLMEGICAGFAELRREIGGLFLRPIETQQPNLQRIASQMRDNYVKRAMQAAEQINAPAQPGFGDVEKFHGQVVEALKNLNKTAFDNRYLIGFYKKDFEKLGEIVQPIARRADELGQWLEKQKPKVRAFETARKDWEEGEKLREEISGWRRKIAEAETDIRQLNDAGASDAEALKKKSEENSRARFDAEARLSQAKSEAVGPVVPLQRLLRKYEHACELKKKSVARKYAENAWLALHDDARQQSLLSLCRDAKAMVAGGRLKAEPKEAAALEALAHALSTDAFERKLAEAAGIEALLNELRGEEKALNRSLGEFEEGQRRAGEMKESIAKARADAEAAENSSKALISRLEKEMEDATAKKVVLPPRP